MSSVKPFLSIFFFMVVTCDVILGDLFGGSAQFLGGHDIEDGQAIEFHQIIEDKQHITEEMDGIYSEKDINQMGPDERAFTWFQAHDTDGDGFLDGLELYKSIHHAIQHNIHEPSSNIEDEFKTGQEDQAAIDLVDEVIEHYDVSNDGILNFQEFISSFKDTEKRLNF